MTKGIVDIITRLKVFVCPGFRSTYVEGNLTEPFREIWGTLLKAGCGEMK